MTEQEAREEDFLADLVEPILVEYKNDLIYKGITKASLEFRNFTAHEIAKLVIRAGYRKLPELTLISPEEMNKVCTKVFSDFYGEETRMVAGKVEKEVAQAQLNHNKKELGGMIGRSA